MLNLLSAITLPLIGEVSLSNSLTIVFLICLLAVVGFEFVNGFHDTANAVATVIYTKALKPVYAIPWSVFFNFLGVFLGGVAVAISFVEANETDILCLVKHHHNIVYRLFNRSTINQVMNKSLKAILILHE